MRRAIAVGWASRAFGRSEAEELALPEVITLEVDTVHLRCV